MAWSAAARTAAAMARRQGKKATVTVVSRNLMASRIRQERKKARATLTIGRNSPAYVNSFALQNAVFTNSGHILKPAPKGRKRK